MPASVFISYCRRNLPFAERLYCDLQRAGLAVWRDLDNINLGEDFDRRIMPAIEAATHMVLLASPEAAASIWVQREVAEAERLGKHILPIRLAGKSGSLPAAWERLNMPRTPVPPNSWEVARDIAGQLEAPNPALPSTVDLLNAGQGTMAEMAALLGDAEPFRDDLGNAYLKIPVAPTGYCQLSLLARQDAPARWPDALAILFNFTGVQTGRRHVQALQHWNSLVPQGAMLMLEGPVDAESNQYDLRTDQPHEWEDAICAGTRTLEEFARGRGRVGYYFNCLVPMAFEIGLRTTQMRRARRVFHFDSRSGRYDLAFDGW